MRFDDRLKTAITQPVVDQHDRVVRWRQLLDLLARLPDEHDEALADAAFALVEREAPIVPEAVRAASARNIANHPIDVRIAALFARDRLSVAAPVLASANLSAMEWREISHDCSAEVANFIQALTHGASLGREPGLVESAAATSVAPPGDALPDETPSISQMVARIEQLRSRRGTTAGEEPSSEAAMVSRAIQPPRPVYDRSTLSVGEGLFRWESDAEGRISWVDGAPRGALVGQALVEAALEPSAERALAAREPFAGAAIRLEAPALAGEWRLSGIPAFSPVDGHFLGYRGVAKRPDGGPQSSSPKPARSGVAGAPRDLDALRETIHEIRTPLNAIIGFAEIIDGQYLGPAHRNYRRRAAEIVTQARMLLEAVQDLDLAARLQGGQADVPYSVRLADVMRYIIPELEQAALRGNVMLSIAPVGREDRCALSEELAARLLKRFLGSVIAAAATGERLTIMSEAHHRGIAIAITRPETTLSLTPAKLMDPAYAADGQQGDLLGLGFALRLARGLVRMIDGDLTIEDGHFLLALPAA